MLDITNVIAVSLLITSIHIFLWQISTTVLGDIKRNLKTYYNIDCMPTSQ